MSSYGCGGRCRNCAEWPVSVLYAGFGRQRSQQLHDLGFAEATVSAGSAERSKTSGVRPASHGLGVDVKKRCYLTRCEK